MPVHGLELVFLEPDLDWVLGRDETARRGAEDGSLALAASGALLWQGPEWCLDFLGTFGMTGQVLGGI